MISITSVRSPSVRVLSTVSTSVPSVGVSGGLDGLPDICQELPTKTLKKFSEAPRPRRLELSCERNDKMTRFFTIQCGEASMLPALGFARWLFWAVVPSPRTINSMDADAVPCSYLFASDHNEAASAAPLLLGNSLPQPRLERNEQQFHSAIDGFGKYGVTIVRH